MTLRMVFFLRLAATAGLLLLVFAAVRLLWYPGAYFGIFGVGKKLLILVVVVLIIGPGLTALVFKPGKKGLKGDLVLLATLEVVIVALSVWTIYARQPYYAVFAVDRFEAVSLPEIDSTRIAFAALRSRPGYEPRLVYAELPNDPEVLDKLIDETVFEGKKDIDRRPEFWKPYAIGIPTLKAAAKPLANLLESDPGRAETVRRWMSRQNGSPDDYLYLPLQGQTADVTMVLHADIGYPVDILPVDPW